MTRINLLVARVVLLGICILCISSVSVWAEEIKISVTAYTLKECYHNKGKTDLPQILVPHVKLGFRHFLFLNSGTPLALENDNSRNYVA